MALDNWGSPNAPVACLVASVLAVLSVLSVGAQAACLVHVDQEGPFHLPGAPFRDQGIVCTPGADESLVTFRGRVLTADCNAVLPNAVLDIWQASSDEAGAQYFGCSGCPGGIHPDDGAFYCRGRVRTDDNGEFEFRTTRPGSYRSRPIVHLHVKVLESEAPGAPQHTTQLYFDDDPSSESYPMEVRLRVDGDGTSVIDIATPFSGGIPLEDISRSPEEPQDAVEKEEEGEPQEAVEEEEKQEEEGQEEEEEEVVEVNENSEEDEQEGVDEEGEGKEEEVSASGASGIKRASRLLLMMAGSASLCSFMLLAGN